MPQLIPSPLEGGGIHGTGHDAAASGRHHLAADAHIHQDGDAFPVYLVRHAAGQQGSHGIGADLVTGRRQQEQVRIPVQISQLHITGVQVADAALLFLFFRGTAQQHPQQGRPAHHGHGGDLFRFDAGMGQQTLRHAADIIAQKSGDLPGVVRIAAVKGDAVRHVRGQVDLGIGTGGQHGYLHAAQRKQAAANGGCAHGRDQAETVAQWPLQGGSVHAAAQGQLGVAFDAAAGSQDPALRPLGKSKGPGLGLRV